MKLTKEQEKISHHNHYLAVKYFNLPKGWVLHHKDETLRHTNIERYIEWRPEDLMPMTTSDHMRLHQTGEKNNCKREEVRKKIGEYRTGKKHSAEAIEKMSECKKGKLNPSYGVRRHNVHKGVVNKRVKVEEYESYLADGWEPGFYKKGA